MARNSRRLLLIGAIGIVVSAPLASCGLVVHQTHGPRALGVEPLARWDHRPGLALTDLGQHERGDDRCQDAELRLREAESRSGHRQDQIGGRAQAHAAAERRTVDTRNDGYRATVHGEQHVVQPSGVGLVLLQGEVARGALPVDVRARTEDRTVPGEDHGTETARRFLAKGRKRLGEGRDELCVERVPNLWPRQGDSGHDASRASPLKAETVGTHRRPRR